MKLELSERLYIEDLFARSLELDNLKDKKLEQIEKLTGDASTRRYYRIFTELDSYVACVDNPTEKGANTFINTQNFLSSYDIRVPYIYDRMVDKGYILEEDLGNTTLLNYLSNIESPVQEFEVYKEIIDMMLSLHNIPLKEIEDSNKFPLKFDVEKLNSEIEFTVSYFISKFLNVDDEKVTEAVLSEFNTINSRIASKPMVLTHRDFHSRNVMVKNEDFVLIDFQDARLGLPQYDLVSLLEDCYYNIPDDNKNKLINYYYDSIHSENLEQGNFEQFMDLYYDMTLQRVFKAVGSFAYIYDTRKDVRYIKYIGFAMEKIRNIMMKQPRYAKLRKILFGIYYES